MAEPGEKTRESMKEKTDHVENVVNRDGGDMECVNSNDKRAEVDN